MSSANRWHDNPEMLPLLKRLMLETMRERASQVNWSEIPLEEVYPGITRQVVQGERQTLVRYVYQPGSVFPEHHHPQEQVTTVLSGRIEFDVAGALATLGPGIAPRPHSRATASLPAGNPSMRKIRKAP